MTPEENKEEATNTEEAAPATESAPPSGSAAKDEEKAPKAREALYFLVCTDENIGEPNTQHKCVYVADLKNPPRPAPAKGKTWRLVKTTD